MSEETTHSQQAAALLSALRFAADKHRKQRRKDLDATPYINHLIAVAELLARVGHVDEVTVLQAAILHDTLEDTETTARVLEETFGPRVCSLVQEVTDDRSLPARERKQRQVEHAPHLSAAAKQIKIADKSCNIAKITPKQPVGWELKRKAEYLDWGEKVVAGCRGCNARLEDFFEALLKEKRKELGIDG